MVSLRINKMHGIYAEGDCSDWFDVDDIAREIDKELGRCYQGTDGEPEDGAQAEGSARHGVFG